MSAFALVPLAVYNIAFSRLSRSAQVLTLYLWTCPDLASEGLFRFRVGAVVGDTGMSVDEVAGAVKELEAEGTFEFDLTNGLVLNTTALRHSPLKMGRDKNNNPVADKKLPGAISRLKGLPIEAEPMIGRLVAIADAWSPDFAFQIRKEWPEILPREAPYDPLAPLAPQAPEGTSRADTDTETVTRRDDVGERDSEGSKDGSGETPGFDKAFLDQVAGL